VARSRPFIAYSRSQRSGHLSREKSDKICSIFPLSREKLRAKKIRQAKIAKTSCGRWIINREVEDLGSRLEDEGSASPKVEAHNDAHHEVYSATLSAGKCRFFLVETCLPDAVGRLLPRFAKKGEADNAPTGTQWRLVESEAGRLPILQRL